MNYRTLKKYARDQPDISDSLEHQKQDALYQRHSKLIEAERLMDFINDEHNRDN